MRDDILLNWITPHFAKSLPAICLKIKQIAGTY
jgi:hypothetical protein